jgi:hypothetical protein
VIDALVDFEAPGEAEVLERGEQAEDEGYASTNLVHVMMDKISCSVSYNEAEELVEGRPFTLRLSAYHMENEETKRAFHTHLSMAMNRAQAQMMRDALDFFIEKLDAE